MDSVGGISSDTPEAIAERLVGDLKSSLSVISNNLLGQTMGIIFGTFSWALTLFAVVFVAASLLSNARSLKAAYLTSVPRPYRHDALAFWDALGHALSRYLGGLGLMLADYDLHQRRRRRRDPDGGPRGR